MNFHEGVKNDKQKFKYVVSCSRWSKNLESTLLLNFHLFSERAVYNAVERGDLNILKLLLERREDKNPVISEHPRGGTSSVLHVAAYEGHVNITRWFHETFPFEDINPYENTGIFYNVLQ